MIRCALGLCTPSKGQQRHVVTIQPDSVFLSHRHLRPLSALLWWGAEVHVAQEHRHHLVNEHQPQTYYIHKHLKPWQHS